MPPRITFNQAFDRLIKIEGGFTKDSRDPGNWTSGRVGVGQLKGTKFGISAQTYPHLNIEALTLEEARGIYYEDWWLKAGGDVFDPAILFQVWDFAINSGMGNAIRILQRAVGVAEDGFIGPMTIQAVKRMDLNDLLLRYLAARLRFLTDLSIWPTYGKGWARRIAANMEYAASDNVDLPRDPSWNYSSDSSRDLAATSPPPSPASRPSLDFGLPPSELENGTSKPSTQSETLSGLFNTILRLWKNGTKR